MERRRLGPEDEEWRSLERDLPLIDFVLLYVVAMKILRPNYSINMN